MSDTQVLLSRIAALRRRLEQARELTDEADSTAVPFEDGAPGAQHSALQTRPLPSFEDLERQVADGIKQTVLLDATLRQLTPPSSTGQPPIFPKQLTARARRVLERGRELLGQLR